MNILIVGGAGYVGGHMTDFLCGQGYNVTVYDNLMYEERYLKPVSFIYGDIRDRSKLLHILPKYDVVVWLAALVGDGACEVDPFLTQSINEDTVEWLSKNYGGKIIFTSTCSVYGINNDLISEDAEPNPISLYAVSKLNAERHIQDNAKSYLIFRLGTLYGLGDCLSRLRLDLVVNILAKKAALKEHLIIYGGDQWRPLLHVRDVATAVSFAIENDIPRDVYNLSEVNIRLADLAAFIKKVVPGVNLSFVDQPDEDKRNYHVDSGKIRNLGWLPKHCMEDGFFEIYNVIHECRIKDVSNPVYVNSGFLNEHYYKL